MMSNSEVTVRPGNADDFPDLVVLEQDSFSDPWSHSSIQEALSGERYRVLLAHSAGVLCGAVIASVVGDEGEIERLAVAAVWRRCGIGNRLLQAALDECSRRGVVRIFLEVRASNEAAQNLYQKAGFCRVGLRRRYHRDGEDAVIMEKVLST